MAPTANPQATADAVEQRARERADLSFAEVPENEALYDTWRFEMVKAVRAKLLNMRKPDTAVQITKFLEAFKKGTPWVGNGGEPENLPDFLETIDANIAVALMAALRKHSKHQLVSDATANGDVYDAIGHIRILDSKLRSSNPDQKKTQAMSDLFALQYTGIKNLENFLEQLRKLGRDAGQSENGDVMMQILISRVMDDPVLLPAVNTFGLLEYSERTYEKLEAYVRQAASNQKNAQKMKQNVNPHTTNRALIAADEEASGAMTLAEEKTERIPKGRGKKGGGKGRWRTEVPQGHCPFHINMINGCRMGADCKMVHTGEPGWGHKPYTKPTPTAATAAPNMIAATPTTAASQEPMNDPKVMTVALDDSEKLQKLESLVSKLEKLRM
jgi:hypothetical protein